MTAGSEPPHGPLARYRSSLSLKLLGLIVACVLVAETVVLIPSIAYHRVTYLQERIEAAFLVSIAYDSPYGEIIDSSIADELFSTAGVMGVSSLREDTQMLIYAPEIDPSRDGGPSPMPKHDVDLMSGWTLERLFAPWATLFSRGDDLISVTGRARYGRTGSVTILVSQATMRKDLFVYACNVFLLSLVISSITAMLVYLWLTRMIVEPVKNMSHNMMAFETDPETPANILVPGDRLDELGVAERSLAGLESRMQRLLSERRRLAALGAGISKISHDLRNILASAQLMSDRLAKSDDPRVRKLSPRLIASLDRAVALSRDTLNFARMEPSTLKKRPTDLRALIDDVFDDAARLDVEFINDAQERLRIEADPTHLYRAVFNIVKNAAEAIAPGAPQASAIDDHETPPALKGRIAVTTSTTNGELAINISDNGPGLPESARAHLFEPFKGSQKPGGSGLGVAIAAEIAKAHGGRLELTHSDPTGSTFTLILPYNEEATTRTAAE
ncbi:MAG: HAMP domain-containing sensor histidine kinase [Pseudomonadota bacterium]